MDSSSTNEEPTRRMNAPQNLPPEDQTRRMDARSPFDSSANVVNQEDILTHHIANVGAQPQPQTPTSPPRTRPLGALEPGALLCGDCVVVRTHHNHESGRPGLFECQAPEGHVMVKVAATDFAPQPELWRKLSHLDHPHVLRIFRTHEAEGRFCEVQEFCTGGTLADFVPSDGDDHGSGRGVPSADWIERWLVPSFRAGIAYLHAQGIVHRDIKPSNLYLRQEENRKSLVIGDFDISSMLQTGHTSRATQRAAGTWIYSPPEAFPRFLDEGASQLGAAVVRSSDYYSLGVVIVELLMGTTSLHQAQLPDLYDFYLQGGRVEIPNGLSPRLSELLGGLLCRNRHRRWGDDEVARWLAHQTTDEDRRRIAEDRGYQLGRSITAFTAFETIKPTTLAELSQALNAEPRVALEELMAGDVMLNWIGQLDAGLARQIRQDREKWRAMPRLALLCARLHLDPAAPTCIDRERSAHSAEEWAKLAQSAVAQRTTSPANLCNQVALAELELWLRHKATPELDAAERVAHIVNWHDVPVNYHANSGALPRNSAGEPKVLPNPALVFEELCYAFLPTKPFLLAPHLAAQTPQQIVQLALGELAEWKDQPPGRYLLALKCWQEGFLEAYLRQRLTSDPGTPSPLLQQMGKVRRDFANKPFIAFETILRLLDPQLPALEIEFDPKALKAVWEVGYGQQVTRTISFRTKGRGMPFAAIQLQCQWDGLQLETHEIAQRYGHINLRLYSQGDTPVGREYAGTLALVGNTTRLAAEKVVVRYKINYPKIQTVRKVLVGACIGAALLGGMRAGAMTVVPRTLDPATAALLSRSSWGVLLGALLFTFYVGYRIWLWALVQYAR